ncbi:unnamed protein product [Rhizophagus irregularis]|uniref:Uncharacterized protein n=1 Tax=Rhizophagus irregularis TaxID=588596 RepID=A0A915YQX0_9GLOM|nr:unnamed protein product [Rhizophagus irregularis]CAB5208299.1 unnamed protein product [Rhizophagus irregularis]CAB5315085.1 unnamed protein product [Rhizophagus irregularis]
MTNIDGNTSKSTIDDHRTSSLSTESDVFEKNDIEPNYIRNLGQTIEENFKKCSEDIMINNSEIMTIVNQAIGEQREVFREFIKASVKSSDDLLTFSVDILFFVECFRNPDQYTNEENLYLLTDLLEESEKNYESTKELKNIISRETIRKETDETEVREKLNKTIGEDSKEIDETELNRILDDETIGMKEKLTKIHNFLLKYINDINEFPHKIDSVQQSSIRKMLVKILNLLKDHPIYTTFGTLFFFGASALASRVLLAIIVYLTGSAGIFCNDVAMKHERNNLVEKINQVGDGLYSIVIEIGRIEDFWSEQIVSIKYLIDNLARFNNENARIKRYKVANQIEKRWKDVAEDCKNYTRLMNDVLSKDRLSQPPKNSASATAQRLAASSGSLSNDRSDSCSAPHETTKKAKTTPEDSMGTDPIAPVTLSLLTEN